MTANQTPRAPRELPDPTPTDRAGWPAIARTALEDAIDSYWRALARREQGFRRVQEAHETLLALGVPDGHRLATIDRWQDWADFAASAFGRAQDDLVQAILIWHGVPGVKAHRAVHSAFPPRGILHGGRLYLASPSIEDLEGDAISRDWHGNPAARGGMLLLVTEPGAVLHLDDAKGGPR